MSGGAPVALLIENPNVRQQLEEAMFRKFDMNKDGKLQLGEVHALTKYMCENVGIVPPPEAHVASVFQACDTDGSGWLGLSQFDVFFMKLLVMLRRDAGDTVEITSSEEKQVGCGKLLAEFEDRGTKSSTGMGAYPSKKLEEARLKRDEVDVDAVLEELYFRDREDWGSRTDYEKTTEFKAAGKFSLKEEFNELSKRGNRDKGSPQMYDSRQGPKKGHAKEVFESFIAGRVNDLFLRKVLEAKFAAGELHIVGILYKSKPVDGKLGDTAQELDIAIVKSDTSDKEHLMRKELMIYYN